MLPVAHNLPKHILPEVVLLVLVAKHRVKHRLEQASLLVLTLKLLFSQAIWQELTAQKSAKILK